MATVKNRGERKWKMMNRKWVNFYLFFDKRKGKAVNCDLGFVFGLDRVWG